jgi:methylmalonyl-CoA mutase
VAWVDALAEQDNAKAEACLAKLTESAALTESSSNGNHPMNLLKLSVDAARARCASSGPLEAPRRGWQRSG